MGTSSLANPRLRLGGQGCASSMHHPVEAAPALLRLAKPCRITPKKQTFQPRLLAMSDKPSFDPTAPS